MPATDDGSAITRIVFIAQERRAPKPRSRSRRIKQWRCPACDKPVEADTLLDFETGWATEVGGRWWTKGVCPHCFNRVQFTKHGAVVIAGGQHVPGQEWVPVPKTVIRKGKRG